MAGADKKVDSFRLWRPPVSAWNRTSPSIWIGNGV